MQKAHKGLSLSEWQALVTSGAPDELISREGILALVGMMHTGVSEFHELAIDRTGNPDAKANEELHRAVYNLITFGLIASAVMKLDAAEIMVIGHEHLVKIKKAEEEQGKELKATLMMIAKGMPELFGPKDDCGPPVPQSKNKTYH